MNVPFLSSTAINRDHYHLVQSVEAANTSEQVDTILVHKIGFLRKQFSRTGGVSLSKCAHALIILLYCWFNTGAGDVKRELLEFALPQAVNLAEAGINVQQKRIGYTFCFLTMDKSHELQLMLVNTLRKDIESPEISRISLALDALIMGCPVDALPAVTPRLIDLLDHYSPLVKSKALLVARNIARDDPHIWTVLSDQLFRRLNDPDRHVITITMRIMQDLLSNNIMKPTEAASLLLERFPSAKSVMEVKLRFARLMSYLIPLVIDERDTTIKLLDIIFNIIETSRSQHALLLECFRILSRVPSEILSPYFHSKKYQPLQSIIESIDAKDPNSMYFCLACLEQMDAKFWAGNTEEFPAIFTEEQVNTIMDYLQSPDQSLRSKVLRTLKMVDKNILLGYLTQLISNSPLNTTSKAEILALEVTGIYEEEGRGYAVRLREICSRPVTASFFSNEYHERKSNHLGIFQEAVETVLLHLRTVSERFRGHFVDEILRIEPSQVTPTLALIIAATTYEYGYLSSLPSVEKLRMVMDLVDNKPAVVQEPLLLTMTRVSAHEETVPLDVTTRVRELRELSKSLIKKRCSQFLTFSDDLPRLRDIITTHKCNTLPEFARALEVIEKHGEHARPMGPYRDQSQVPASATKGGLRYEAYEAPKAPLKQNWNRPRGLSHNSSSELSSRDVTHTPSISTFSPGQLALAVYEVDLSKAETEVDNYSEPGQEETGDDLIALDPESPFLVDAIISTEGIAPSETDIDFNYIWETLNNYPSIRGWNEREMGQILTAFYTQYKGQYDIKDFRSSKDLNLALFSASSLEALAAIKLQPAEEGTTLWQIRCPDAGLRTELKSHFS